LRGKLKQYGACALLVQLVMACSPSAPEPRNDAVAAVNDTARANDPQPADAKLVVAFGDSLYAGYNLGPKEGFAPVLESVLEKRGIAAEVVNAGVSGDTSAAGLARLAFTLDGLPRKPDLVVLGLGGNDMLRGLPPQETRANLEAMLAELKKRDIPVLLTGMLTSPNMGPDYAKDFNALYPALAKQYGVPLYPFFLTDVIGKRDLMLPDGIHPNAQGVTIVADHVAPMVAEALGK